MPGFDWNGNGKSDAFDHFMDMEVMSSSSGDDSEELDIDTDIDDVDDDTDDDIDLHRAAVASSVRKVYTDRTNRTANGTQGTATSFQDELKKSMRSPETVRRENAERDANLRTWEAQRKLEEIKKALVYNAQNAKYTVQNGVTTVSCIVSLDYRFLRTSRHTNTEQLRANNQRFVLFRDPTLKYESWETYDVKPEHSAEYHQLIKALEQLAAKENITIQSVIYNSKSNEEYPFPTRMRTTYGTYYLGIRATTIIATDPNYTPPNNDETPSASTKIDAKTEPSAQKAQDDNATTIVKSILCVGVCVLGFVICLSADIGKLGMALVMIGAAALGYFIMKK